MSGRRCVKSVSGVSASSGGLLRNVVIADPDLAEITDELATRSRAIVLQPNLDAVGIPHPNAAIATGQLVATVQAFRLGVDHRLESSSFTPHLHRPGMIHLQGPLDLIETVSTGTGHLTTGIGSAARSNRVGTLDEDVRVVSDRLRHAAPGIPIQLFGNWLGPETGTPRGWDSSE